MKMFLWLFLLQAESELSGYTGESSMDFACQSILPFSNLTTIGLPSVSSNGWKRRKCISSLDFCHIVFPSFPPSLAWQFFDPFSFVSRERDTCTRSDSDLLLPSKWNNQTRGKMSPETRYPRKFRRSSLKTYVHDGRKGEKYLLCCPSRLMRPNPPFRCCEKRENLLKIFLSFRFVLHFMSLSNFFFRGNKRVFR